MPRGTFIFGARLPGGRSQVRLFDRRPVGNNADLPASFRKLFWCLPPTLSKNRREIRGGGGAAGNAMSNEQRRARAAPPRAVRMRLELWPIARLVTSPRNARTHADAQIAEIAGSIRTSGSPIPILVGDEGDVIAGHGRLAAALTGAGSEVPVIGFRASTRSAPPAGVGRQPDRAERRLGHRNAAFGAQGPFGARRRPVSTGIHLEGAGDRCRRAPGGLTDEMKFPGAGRPSPAGDIWCLGPHRLACGDSTDADSRRPACALRPR